MPRPGDSDVIQTPEAIKEVSFEELCTVCHITPDFVLELIAYGTIEPQGGSVATWRFNSQQLQIIRTAIRLHHDLEVNHAGVALAIDLLQQIEDLQTQLNILRRYFRA